MSPTPPSCLGIFVLFSTSFSSKSGDSQSSIHLSMTSPLASLKHPKHQYPNGMCQEMKVGASPFWNIQNFIQIHSSKNTKMLHKKLFQSKASLWFLRFWWNGWMFIAITSLSDRHLVQPWSHWALGTEHTRQWADFLVEGVIEIIRRAKTQWYCCSFGPWICSQRQAKNMSISEWGISPPKSVKIARNGCFLSMCALHQNHWIQTGWLRKDKMKFRIPTNAWQTKKCFSQTSIFFQKFRVLAEKSWHTPFNFPSPSTREVPVDFFYFPTLVKSCISQGSIRKFSGKPRETLMKLTFAFGNFSWFI